MLSRGVKLGDSASNDAGTLRFNGGKVQFNNGTSWVDLASGSGCLPACGRGGAVAYAGGNVGIGTFSSPPTYRLEVDLGDNSVESGRARFGNAVCNNGSAAFQGYAYFYHRNHSSNTNYALRQGPAGNVNLNAPNGQPISIRHDGTQVRLGVSASGAVVVGGETNLAGAGTAVLQVAGEAFKNTGSGSWIIPSDARLKEDICDLEVGLQQLLQVRPVRFRFNGKAGTPAGHESVGITGRPAARGPRGRGSAPSAPRSPGGRAHTPRTPPPASGSSRPNQGNPAQDRERRVGDALGTPSEPRRSSSWKTTTSPVPQMITSSSTPSAPSARARANAPTLFSLSIALAPRWPMIRGNCRM